MKPIFIGDSSFYKLMEYVNNESEISDSLEFILFDYDMLTELIVNHSLLDLLNIHLIAEKRISFLELLLKGPVETNKLLSSIPIYDALKSLKSKKSFN
jgi:hypothetical protein